MRSLERRERRTIAIGATISLVALVTAFGIVPAARRWADREEAIRLSRARVERLRGLGANQAALIAAAATQEATSAGMAVRLLRGRTPALAASELQRLLQQQAQESRVSVNRLDIADADVSSGDGAIPVIPATVSAVTDVYGLADFLGRLQKGNPLVEVTEVTVTANSTLRGGEMLQVTLALRAPYLVTP